MGRRCSTVDAVWAIALDSAKQTGLLVAGGLALFALASAWLIKQVISKLLTILVLGGLALLVWTQRASLDDCADGVMESLRAGAVDDTTCTFFGRDVTIRSPLGD